MSKKDSAVVPEHMTDSRNAGNMTVTVQTHEFRRWVGGQLGEVHTTDDKRFVGGCLGWVYGS